MSIKRTFDLQLQDGRRVQWDGANWQDAAQRTADEYQVSVVAWRDASAVGLHIGLQRIVDAQGREA